MDTWARISLTSWRRTGRSRSRPSTLARTFSNALPTCLQPTSTRAYVQQVEPNQVFRTGERVRIMTVDGTSRVTQ